MSRYTGKRSALAMMPPTMFNATVTGMTVTKRVVGIFDPELRAFLGADDVLLMTSTFLAAI
jgi:hypothetical protein